MREEINKLHERVNGLAGRVVNLEAQQPHTVAALKRIEKSVERLNGHLVRAIWIVLALFLTALWRVVSTGNLPSI
jgi:hypothetical protein